MENLPIYITAGFILTTFITVYIFYKAANNSKKILLILLAWLALQAAIGFNRVLYHNQYITTKIYITYSASIVF
jgi:heme A synthase